jgi:hypothetical protein
MRKTILGRVLHENPKEVTIKIETKVPDKWLFVDLESGRTYLSNNGRGWLEPTPAHFREAKKVISSRR